MIAQKRELPPYIEAYRGKNGKCDTTDCKSECDRKRKGVAHCVLAAHDLAKNQNNRCFADAFVKRIKGILVHPDFFYQH